MTNLPQTSSKLEELILETVTTLFPNTHPRALEACIKIDSTKLETLRNCFRRGFLRHICGYQGEGSHHLVYGQIIHTVLEHLMKETNCNYAGHKDAACALFMAEWWKHYPREAVIDPAIYESMRPKTPPETLLLIQEYIDRYYLEDRQYKCIDTELSNYVTLSESGDRLYLVLDSAISTPNGVMSMEHKTTGSSMKPMKTGDIWLDQWQMRSQLFAQVYMLKTIFGVDEQCGVIVNGIAPGKTDKSRDFRRAWVIKSMRQLEAWRQNVLIWFEDITRELERFIHQHSQGKAHLPIYNDSNCTEYFTTCRFLDTCRGAFYIDSGWRELQISRSYWDPEVRKNIDAVTGEEKR